MLISKGFTPKEKRSANIKVRKAIKSGELIKPTSCSECGEGILNILAHHEDYGKPLQVEWLCHSCHGKRHSDPNLPPQKYITPIKVYMTDEEKKVIEDEAKEGGYSASSWIRGLIIKELKKRRRKY